MEVTQGMGQGETIRWIAIGEGGGAGGRRRTDTHMPGMMGDQRDKAALTYIKCTALTESAQAMSIEEYITVDEAVKTAQTMSLTDTPASVRPIADKNNDGDEDKEDDEPALPQVTCKGVVQALAQVKSKGLYKLWLK
ncbi:hypothetical protein RRG08_029850 [Elysia crispata]|uniref:Uncharacterized protein n=1 Tax=Elysia crispata TaxID=231223 RepID=A0AAE1AL41_9GAST|nr:hypothetical protein RRG08_029850 [Elysia crispata]